MAGHVYLGNDVDIAVGSILHHLAYLLLGVVTAVALTVVDVRIAPHSSARTPGTHLGEAGILLNLDAPALVVGEMPVKAVHVVQGQQVDVLLDEIDREEVSGAVQVHAPVTKPRRIGNDGGRQGYLGGRGEYGQTLAQGLYAVEHALRSASGYHYAAPRYLQAVALGLAHLGVYPQQYITALVVLVGRGRSGGDVGLLADVGSQKLSVARHVGPALIYDTGSGR